MKKPVALVVSLLVLGIVAYLLFYSPGYLLKNSPRQQRSDIINPPAVEEEKEGQITVFFLNQDYIVTGNEELARVLPVERIVRYQEGELYETVIEELKRPPTGSKYGTALREGINVIGSRKEGSTVFINFSSVNLHGGSLEESLLVEQVVKTLTGLDGIDEVQFLVDGEIRESLMGHIGTENPLTIMDVE